jgi:hypothetical protein
MRMRIAMRPVISLVRFTSRNMRVRFLAVNPIPLL